MPHTAASTACTTPGLPCATHGTKLILSTQAPGPPLLPFLAPQARHTTLWVHLLRRILNKFSAISYLPDVKYEQLGAVTLPFSPVHPFLHLRPEPGLVCNTTG